MKNVKLSKELQEKYKLKKFKIRDRLKEFKNISPEKYFYELCFCICTPQSKAKSALAVQEILEADDFRNSELNLQNILSNRNHYIRFHNQKSIRLNDMKVNYSAIEKVLLSEMSSNKKRDWLSENVKGIGMKESSHFLRNIGHIGLGILDRHILKHLVACNLFIDIPNISSNKNYKIVENKFFDFANHIGIPIDELDLLFWSEETGEIVK